MKHISMIVFAFVSVVAIFTMLAGVDFIDQFSPMIIQPPTSGAAKTVVIQLPFGGRLGQFMPGLDGSFVSGLASGTVQTGEGRTQYTQTLIFNVAGFQGLSTDFRTIDFPTLGAPTESLYCLGGSQDVWAEYRIDFGSALRGRTPGNSTDIVSYRNEKIMMLGGVFSFVSARISADTPNGVLELRLMGPGGMVIFTDNPYDAAATPFGTRINGVNVPISVQMMGSKFGTEEFALSNIILQFQCQGLAGELEVPKMGCVSQYLQYPLINPDFDVCLLGTDAKITSVTAGVTATPTGMAAVSGADFSIEHRGSTRLDIRGYGYKVPFLYLQGGVLNGGKDANQRTWWVEQGGNWIATNHNFITNSLTNNDRAEVRVYQFRGADTNNNNLELRDLRGKSYTIPYDPATGNCINRIQNGGNGAICNYNAATGLLAVDQDAGGTYAGTALWITPRHLMINLGAQAPGANTVITYTMLSRRIPEGGGNIVETTTITGADPITQRIISTATCPVTPEYDYGCMGLAGFFNLDDREHGGDIYVGGSSPGGPTATPTTERPGTFQSSKSGWTNIVLTFEASKLRGT